MSNRYRSCVDVLPEDDANRDIANGFWTYPYLDARRMRVLPPAGGWMKVLNSFESEHIPAMRRFPKRFLVLVIDFDEQPERLGLFKEAIPNDLEDRVFVLGAFGEPEDFSGTGLGTKESIGHRLARDCHEGTDTTWGHDLLKHNSGELARLREFVQPILFRANPGTE
jgi:hypothetical protein